MVPTGSLTTQIMVTSTTTTVSSLSANHRSQEGKAMIVPRWTASHSPSLFFPLWVLPALAMRYAT